MREDPEVLALVERAAHGDGCAWERIVRRYAPLVWSVCRRFNISGADADDVGAIVWFRLVKHLAALRNPAALPGWLATTTYNECLAVLRHGSREISTASQSIVASVQPPPDTWLLQEERRIELRAAFAQLPCRDQRLLAMLFADPPASYTEISAALDIPIGAIGPTRQRCLARLRRSPALMALRA